MNYQFTHDETGKPKAVFEMGGEVFSFWFTEELSNDKLMFDTIFKAIKKIQNKEIREFVYRGKETILKLDTYEVELKSLDLELGATDELPEGTELYEQEFISGCGLEDFISVLHSWDDFSGLSKT